MARSVLGLAAIVGAEVAVDRVPQGDVILRLDVLDPRADGGHAVGHPDERVLHLRRQAGDRPAGDARRGDALAPVAGELEDRLEAVAEHLEVGVEREDAPDRPPFAVVVQRLAGDGDRLGPVRRPRGHREHQDFGAGAEEGVGVALADAVDVRLVPVVAADRDPAAEVGGGPDLGEVVVAAELAVGVAGDAGAGEVALDVAGPAGLLEERRGRAAGPCGRGRPTILRIRSSIGALARRPCDRERPGSSRSRLGLAASDRSPGPSPICRPTRPRRGFAAGRGGLGRSGRSPAGATGSSQAARGVAGGRSRRPVGVRRRVDLAAAVVLRPGDDPEFLRLARLGEQGPGDRRARCTRPSRRGSSARGGGRAGTARSTSGTGSSAGARSGPGRPRRRTGRRRRHAAPRNGVARRKSPPSGGCRRASSPGREGPVGDHPPDGRVLAARRRGPCRRPGSRRRGRTRRGRGRAGSSEIREGRLEVADLVVGDPLERLVGRVAVALAVVPEVEREDVVPESRRWSA